MAQMQESLTRMSDTDEYEIAADDLDIRGWSVSGPAGQRVGKVSDLLIDRTAMKVRQIEVKLDNGAARTADGDGRVNVPIESAHLDPQQREVIVSGMPVAQHAVTAEDHSEMRRDTAGATTVATDYNGSDQTRRITRAEEELRVGTRAVPAGEVRIGKHVETERVREPVTLEKERVVIERRPVTDTAASADIRVGEQGEIVVPITDEEAVVEKRAVVKEEIVVSKERLQETEMVEAEVRKEQFDITDAGQRIRKGGR